MKDATRREAFASLLPSSRTKQASAIRPPYAKKGMVFETHCFTCKDFACVEACEEGIIALDEKNVPHLVFDHSGCTFCQACALACSGGVLDVHASSEIKAKFLIDIPSCLAWNGVVCASCADVCPTKAITFLGIFRPMIEQDLCTRCGFCYGVCPVKALNVKGA